ncbi:MAG: DUF418 domain-containing protein [Pseudomonadota bacterium]|nr:DUF418 domain-containing protein [Pseudomonadota bacterium]
MTDQMMVPTSQRLESLDFIRGCALFGILMMNIVGMGLGSAYDNPTIAGGATGINLWTWLVINIGFEGTQRALFSILFGAGVILLSSRMEASGRPDSGDVFFRRNLWLIGFGLVNSWILLWTGDILYYYGVTALFLYVFRKLPGKTLLTLGIGALLLGAAWSALDVSNDLNEHRKYEAAAAVAEPLRTTEQKDAIKEFQKAERAPLERFEKLRKATAVSYWRSLEARAPRIVHAQSYDLYRYFFDIFGMMMIGMALFRLGVLTLEARTRTYVAMTLAGYAIGLTINILEARWIMGNAFSQLSYAEASVSYDLSRFTMTMGHLGLLCLFLRSGILPFVRRSMAAVGRMALTNYLTHSVIALVIFVLLGWFGEFQRHQLYFVVVSVWAAQFLLSPIWLRHFHFGPVEWLWRYLTYGERPAFRKAAARPPTGAMPQPA